VIGLKRRRLLRALTERDEEARWAAAKKLLLDKDAATLRKLQRMLESGEREEARGAAAYVLGFCGKPEVAPELARVLADRTESAVVRAHAAEALGHLLQYEQVLAEVRHAIFGGLRDPEPQVRFWSAFAAAALELKETRLQLARLAATDQASVEGWWSVAEEAEWALRVLDGESDAPLPKELA
jgi:HEAT repeat protein